MKKIAFISLLFTFIGTANAAIVNGADVNGLTTFEDTNTNRIWLRMDNFFDAATATGTYTGNDMIAAAQNAGFTFALRSDVEELLNTLPLDSNNQSIWGGYASIMGYSVPRDLIWGMYDANDANSTYGWGYSHSDNDSWQFWNNAPSDPSTLVGDAGSTDMGIWAYMEGTPTTTAVPEPETYAMFLAGLGLMGFASRRRKAD